MAREDPLTSRHRIAPFALFAHALGAGALGGFTAAQEPEPKAGEVKAAVEVSIVAVDVLVLDAKGRPVPGLTAADFEVKVDGKPRPLEYVEAGRPAPAVGPGASPEAAPPPEPAAPGTRPGLRLLFYFDLEALSRPALDAGARAVRAQLAPLSGRAEVTLVSRFGPASVLLRDERSFERVDEELERLTEHAVGGEASSVVDAPGFRGGSGHAGPRTPERREVEERSLIDEVLRAEEEERAGMTGSLSRALGNAQRYLDAESERSRDAVAELRGAVARFAEGGGRRNVFLVTEGFERVPGQAFASRLEAARATRRAGEGFASAARPPTRQTVTGLPLVTSPAVDDLERTLSSSGVMVHFLTPPIGSDLPSAASPGWDRNRDLSGERRLREEGPERLADATGGLVRPATRLDTLLEAASGGYRLGVRLPDPAPKGTLKLSVAVKGKGLFVRSARRVEPPAAQASASLEVARARRSVDDARREERRGGVARLSAPRLPVSLRFAGKVREDDRQPGKGLYRVEVVVPQGELAFEPAEDGFLASIRLAISATGTGTTKGGDEATLDLSPSYTSADWKVERDRDLVRPVTLSLAPGTYRVTAAVVDLLGDRSGVATLESLSAE